MNLDETIDRTPNPNCGACLQKRWHYPGEWRTFHPMSTHGFTKEQGWTHADLLPAGVPMKHAAPVSGISPLEKASVYFHAQDGNELLCRESFGFFATERLEVTCPKCLEILNR